jgi:DNA repair exonuclease SbcCD nuclease subunit
MQITIAALADIHFGACFSQTITLYNALKEQVIERRQDTPPDIIIIAGDYFDRKLTLNSIEATLANDFMVKLTQIFPKTYILVLKGTRSHDLDQLHLFKPLQGEYFRIYETVIIEYILGIRLLIIPEEYYPDKGIYEKFLSEKVDWVVFHGMFKHAGGYTKLNNPNKICFSAEDFKGKVWGRVIGGHIHKPLTYQNVDYINSFDRWCHGEEEPKGYRVYTYDTTKHTVLSSEFIENPHAHQYITLPYQDIAGLDEQSCIEYLHKRVEGVKSLRIKIEKEDEISEEKLHQLLTISFAIPNLIIDKKSKGITLETNTSYEKQQELERRKEEISQYSSLNFEDITTQYAKNKFNATITEEHIKMTLQ